MKLWIDGARAGPVTLDRGLEFGDGLFETMAVVDGRPRLLARHLARLATGCGRLGIEMPLVATLTAELTDAAREAGVGALKLVVTRGAGGQGYAADPASPPRRWVAALPPRVRPAEFASHGVSVRWCSGRLAEQPLLAGLKHLNRLEQVLARREWRDPAIAEGLMLDVHGRLVCGTMTNVFTVFGTEIVTPALTRCGVAGVVRAALIDAFRAAGLSVTERDLGPHELDAAAEVFLTNALIGVWPVKAIEHLSFIPGPIARRAQAWVAAW